MKKLFALLLALTMVFSLATTAFAADITINDGDVTGAEYAAYKLLNATDGGNGKFAYTVNDTYRTVLQGITDADTTDNVVPTDEEIIAYIATLDATGIRTFADAVYAQVKTLDADYTASENVFTGVDQGYYLIVETATGSAEDFDEDTFSLVMLDTAGQDNITVETKEELPKSQKKVKDINDSTETTYGEWKDSADHDIDDKVPFQITFTLPADYANYEQYTVGIHDDQSAGLTFDSNSVVVYIDTDKDGIKDDDEPVITNWFTTTASGLTDDCTFHIECADIVAEAADDDVTLAAGSVITFEYTSTLNDDAVLGSTGNPNEMTVEFSNNPYGDGTSRTPEDRVIVFTYGVNVDKYTKVNGVDTALTGADFTLYKEVPSTYTGAQTGAAIKEAYTNDNIKAGALGDTKYYIVVANKTTDVEGDTFDFKGVDDGNYVLVETTIPAGYNAWDAVAFTIDATHTDGDTPTLTSLTGGDLVTGEFKNTGIIATDIENKTGTELPSTGGMGTTLFYIVGGLMVAGAAILLVTKKRMGAEA